MSRYDRERARDAITGRMVATPAASRFAESIEDRGGCWIWLGCKSQGGYGYFKPNGKTVYAHRWAWEQAHGAIPAGLQIDHLCRTPACVNPAHLEVVTPAENTRRAPRTRLTVDVVREIRARLASGERQRAIARDYAVTQSAISYINRRRNWRDVA